MTHLGVIRDMDMNGEKQWIAIKTTIERLREIISKSNSRKRDMILVINFCLKSTVLYRLQFCTWDQTRFEELDKSLNRLIREVKNNMRNFPGEVINMAVEEGGLGIRSLSDEANERKLGLLTKGIEEHW